MQLDVGNWNLRRVSVLSNAPLVVGAIAFVCWGLAVSGIYAEAGGGGAGVLLNPLNYLLTMVLHSDWGHFLSNMRLWIPVGIVFTLLTSNRHVLLVAVVAHVTTQIVSSGLLRFGTGLSVAVFAILMATLVRSIGYAFQNHSMEALQNALAIGLIPMLAGVFLIVVLAGPSDIGHLEHFLGALFGCAIESIYVLSEHETASTESSRSVSRFR